jgi:hypothetical protein
MDQLATLPDDCDYTEKGRPKLIGQPIGRALDGFIFEKTCSPPEE